MDKFCKFCGVEHTDPEYPKTCTACSNITWINPTPVALILQPVWSPDGQRQGILIGQRGIQPQKGGWGLPGGFMDPVDASVEHAASRELFEETCLRVPHHMISIMGSYGTGKQMLVCCHGLVGLSHAQLDDFMPNFECPKIDVAWEPRDLCFPSHTEFLRKWFERFT